MGINIDKVQNKPNEVYISDIKQEKGSIDTVPISKPQSQTSKEEVQRDVDAVIGYTKSELDGLKDTLKNGPWLKKKILNGTLKLLGISSQSIDEAGKICNDKKFSSALKDFVKNKQVLNLSDFLSDEKSQDDIIILLQNYTETNNYPNLRHLLDRKLVKKEIKSYLKDVSETYKK